MPAPDRATVSAPLNLTVAGTQLQFRGAHGLRLEPSGFEYPAFMGDHPFDRHLPIDVSIVEDSDGNAPSAPCADPSEPAAAEAATDNLLFDTQDGWLLTGNKDWRCVRMPLRGAQHKDREKDLWRASWHEPMQRASAQVRRDLVEHGVLRHFVQYPLDQILLTTLLASEGALLLHACGGMTPAGGVAFAGVSGAGKSTLSRLLADSRGMRFFSDDRLFIRRQQQGNAAQPRDAQFQLHGTPWAGDAHIARNEHAPLAALCFLTQAASTQLRELTPAAALQRLLPVATLPWFDKTGIGRALDACALLIANVPCYELWFTPCRQSIERALQGLERG